MGLVGTVWAVPPINPPGTAPCVFRGPWQRICQACAPFPPQPAATPPRAPPAPAPASCASKPVNARLAAPSRTCCRGLRNPGTARTAHEAALYKSPRGRPAPVLPIRPMPRLFRIVSDLCAVLTDSDARYPVPGFRLASRPIQAAPATTTPSFSSARSNASLAIQFRVEVLGPQRLSFQSEGQDKSVSRSPAGNGLVLGKQRARTSGVGYIACQQEAAGKIRPGQTSDLNTPARPALARFQAAPPCPQVAMDKESQRVTAPSPNRPVWSTAGSATTTRRCPICETKPPEPSPACRTARGSSARRSARPASRVCRA